MHWKFLSYMGYLFALGFISILGQVVLLRELSVASYGVELVYTLALGIWLITTAGGALFRRRTPSGSATAKIHILFMLFSLTLPLDVAFLRSVRILFAGYSGIYLPLQFQLLAIFASLLPVGLILGTLFRWTAERIINEGGSLAGAYAIESVGGLAGGLCSTELLKFGFQNLVIALICALVALGASFLDSDKRFSSKVRFAACIIFVALIFLVWKAPVVDRIMTSWTHPDLVATTDSPYSRITVTYSDGQTSVFENDALLFDTESTRAEQFVHLAALQHPNPGRVLVLGGGVEGTVREILLHSPRIVDYVELNPILLRLVPPNVPSIIQKSLQDNRVRIFVDDPRRFLEQAPPYDIILVGMPEPTSGQANRFYTQEFFRQCRAKLTQNGIVAFSLQSSENIWTPLLTRRMVSIYRAIVSVFPETLFIPGTTNVVIASKGALTKDPEILAARLHARHIEDGMVSDAYLRYVLTNDRFTEIAKTLQSETAPINTDIQPICYQYTVLIWLSKFLPALKFSNFHFPEFRGLWSIAWLVALSLPALLLSSARWPIRRAVLMGIGGLVGMTLETVLLLYFQIKSGILYQDIGILLTGFMAGLAVGAFAVEKAYPRPKKAVGLALLGGFVALSGLIGWSIKTGLGTGLAGCFGFLILTGFLVSGIFAYAALREPDNQLSAITPLYVADLIGGCFGSLLTSLVLAPMTGLVASSHLMVPLLMLSALLL
jgi:spermidine synthase